MGEISMVYRLLAVNIDGTLLQSNGRLSKATKEAIGYVHQKGVRVALVTSRNYHSAKKVAARSLYRRIRREADQCQTDS